MTLVPVSDSDASARQKLLTDVVLPRFAQRCGSECTKQWNATVGKIANLKAPE
jgi:hypothetical protein